MSIKLFLTICFVLISFIFEPSSYCVAKDVQKKLSSFNKDARLISVVPFVGNNVFKLKTTINFQDVQLSGLMIVKLQSDTVVGVFMNEFGIKAFEFATCHGKCKISNLVSRMNKWYIRKTLSEDLAFIFTTSTLPFENDCLNKGFQAKYSKKMMYSYFFNPNCKIQKIERKMKKDITGILTFDNDTSFTMNNLKRNITYKMNFIVEEIQN